jgi:cytochrome c oxidase assembly protein subunit 11
MRNTRAALWQARQLVTSFAATCTEVSLSQSCASSALRLSHRPLRIPYRIPYRAQSSSATSRAVAGQKKAKEQGLYLVSLVVGMVGLTYASVPLYRLFCQATGFGGTVKEGATVEEKLQARLVDTSEERARIDAAAAARELIITFDGSVSDGLEWKFTPTQRQVSVHPGQSTLAFFTVENLSKTKALTGVSTYNVTPQQVGQYFNKIQCFCFEEQRLRPGEKIDMPVFFYIDPEYTVDPRVDRINNITLSYTFFKVDADEDIDE